MTEREIREQAVKAAREWLGKKESDGSHSAIIDLYNAHTPLPRGYKVRYTDAWCATYVSAVFIKLGYTDIAPPECSCTRMIDLYKAIGAWQEDESVTPQIGDVAFYDWQDSTAAGDNRGAPDHVGIVAAASGGMLTVIEGNYGGAVKERVLQANGRYLRGFGQPAYWQKTSAQGIAPATPSGPPAVSSWAAVAWAWAQAMGLCDATRPRDPITREEFVTILHRFAQSFGK
ncbi:MAG: CHAP domain-containing protein [Clostridiales bacterium]|jgi:hypothetical protein|nr:CHAP domain-containing protein [Clostridiales bacterium]